MTREVTVTGEAGGFLQTIDAAGHTLLADEPVSEGGTDQGPNPYELLLSALGACTSMTMRVYANLKKWPLGKVTVKLKHDKIYAKDCADCETKEGKVDRIEREIHLEGALSEDQKTRLLEIAKRCPVGRTLESEIKIESRLV